VAAAAVLAVAEAEHEELLHERAEIVARADAVERSLDALEVLA